jgi:ATP-binding cassette subfamily B protein
LAVTARHDSTEVCGVRFRPKLNPALSRIRPLALFRIFATFGSHVRPHVPTLVVAGVCSVGLSLAEMLRPWPIKLIFDDVFDFHLRKGHLDLGARLGVGKDALLAILIAAFITIAILRGVFRHRRAYLTASVGEKVLVSIRSRLYSHVQRLSRAFHDRHRSGDILTRLTRDTGSLGKLLSGSLFEIADSLLPLLGMIAVMLWMDWQLTLVALVTFPFLMLVVFRFSGPIKEAASRQRQRESEITSSLGETLSAVAVVQAFAREQYEAERFFNRNRAEMKASLRSNRLTVSFNRLIDLILAAGSCLVLWVGAYKVLRGVLTPGDLLVFTAYLSRVYGPLARLANISVEVSRATVCGERVMAILETEPDIKDAPGAVVAPPFRGEIVFDDVAFQYRRGEPVLQEVNFAAKPGQVVAVVGASGAGKSTVANLLLRFYDPVRGRVLIDGRDVRDYTLASLRAQISVVLQETILFAASIRENIAYGRLDATLEEIVGAAKAADAHDFIVALEYGYDTIVGERGATLSGGQRQRIAIARALIRNTPILILDEPMTGLDVESAAVVRGALKRLMAGRTCLLITHDLESVADADQILLLDGGRIVERGTHTELLATAGRYGGLVEFWGERVVSERSSITPAAGCG